MKKKHVIILGGGISGLAARYFLAKQNPDITVTLLEKEERLGGVIQTENKNFFFERGPRTFQSARSPKLLALIDELGLHSKCIFSDPHAKRRYLWKDGKLQQLPSHPLSLLTSSLGRKLIPALLKERKRPYPWAGDETIYAFAERRLGADVAETFFDPMTLGIYAGDIRRLSIESCFPSLKEMEVEYGSLTRAFFKRKKKSKKKGLFTLEGGVSSCIQALEEQGKGDVCTGFEATNVKLDQGQVVVSSSQETVKGTHLVCALSAGGAEKLLSPVHPAFEEFYQALGKIGLVVVNIGFNQDLLPVKGFGYLIPSSQNQSILGVVFDSTIFPEQNQGKKQTRLTVMLGGAFHPQWAEASDAACKEEALRGIKDHLHIKTPPDYLTITRYPATLPELTVGHQERVSKLEMHIRERFPKLTLAGNYLHGVSVESCVRQLNKLMSKI